MKSIGFAFCFAALLSGCAGGALRSAGAQKLATAEGYREAAEVTFACSGGEDGGGVGPALAAPLVGILVDTAVGAVSAMLADAQKARTGSWTASRAIDLGDCTAGTLTITRGLYREGRLLNGDPGPEGKAVYPAFRLAADVTIRTDGSGSAPARVVTIVPIKLIYSETSARSRGSGRKAVLLNIGIAAAGDGKGDAGGAGAMLIDLGKLEIGRVYTGFNMSAAIAVPASPAHNLAIIVTESEEPTVVLKAFSAAFDANKGDLSTALKSAIKDAIGAK